MLFDVHHIKDFYQSHKLFPSNFDRNSDRNGAICLYYQNTQHHVQNKFHLIHFYTNVLNYLFL